MATSQTDWKTADTAITNSYDTGYYPAACCCARYGAPDNSTAPKGTSSFLKFDTDNTGYDYSKGVTGVWYMPACGELGFIMPHLKRNNTTIENVKTLYGITNCVTVDYGWYWSSSEYSVDNATDISTENGKYYHHTIGKDNYVSVFCAL